MALVPDQFRYRAGLCRELARLRYDLLLVSNEQERIGTVAEELLRLSA